MRLKYKLFLSYFVLIIFFSLSLFVLIAEIRALTTTLRQHVRQDVKSVILLTRQQQKLEQLYDHYLVLYLPSQNWRRHLQTFRKDISDFDKNWERFLITANTPYELRWFDRLFLAVYRKIYRAERKDFPEYEQAITKLQKDIEQSWRKLNRLVTYALTITNQTDFIGKNRGDRRQVQQEISRMRKQLADLGKTIGQKGVAISIEMGKMAQATQHLVIVSEGILIVLSILIAFVVAYRLSRPLENLKTAMELVAIRNFDIELPTERKDELGDLTRAFEQLTRRLKENEEFKSAMLSQFTHEMKSPLGAIRQATELLESTAADALGQDQKRLLSIIKGNNETLFQLINKILQSAAYDEHRIEIKYRRTNFVKLLTQTLILLSPIIKRKSIRVDLNFFAQRIDCEVDVEKMQEVFQNLISNAIKFSPPKSRITVSLSLEKKVIVLKIRDEGIGIPEEEIPFIFEKLYRASNSRQISVKGTGLGLYVTSQIVEAHGGKIRVHSKPGEGSEFIVYLPQYRFFKSNVEKVA